ncbi:MAG: hypothetical protein K8S87_09380 [Planctomycetes bacterium]|nr:hypothetical protein [Planctomycetota bacterium]
MVRMKKGTTLVEVSMAVLIITIMIIVIMSSFSYAQVLLIDRGNERLAMNLAKAELEKTLAFAYTGIIPGTTSYNRQVGDLKVTITLDVAEYRYDFDSEMDKVSGSTALPTIIDNMPFGTDWTHPTVSGGLRYRLVRITASWGSNQSVSYEQIIAEGWRD